MIKCTSMEPVLVASAPLSPSVPSVFAILCSFSVPQFSVVLRVCSLQMKLKSEMVWLQQTEEKEKALCQVQFLPLEEDKVALEKQHWNLNRLVTLCSEAVVLL